ncbi:MAG: alcohol dehydrogenase catalytic domain-containing protein [Pseudonocardiaceae bacterium]|nr:alcohol dehydrogenase catalytic domain-containing protein [Pseudonocardiaceae bacterium]
MKAVRWHGVHDVRVDDVAKPEIIDPEDAILRVTTAAICGSDLHLYHGKVPKLRPGTTIGHEFVGVVDAVGPGVRSVEPGQRYVASMATACGRCSACIAGTHMGCGRYALFGYGDLFGGLDGGQAEYVRVPIADVTLSPISDGLSDEQAIFVGDILSTAYTSCDEIGLEHGDIAVVVGAGPVGQLAVQCAQLSTPSAVYVVDLVEERLQQAAATGAVPINAAESDPRKRLLELTGGRRADVVIEAVGNAKSLETAWKLAGTSGRIALAGFLVDEPFPDSAGRTWLRNLTVRTIVGQPIKYRDRLTRLIEAGKLAPEGIITDRVPIDGAVDAYKRLDRREIVKVVMSF